MARPRRLGPQPDIKAGLRRMHDPRNPLSGRGTEPQAWGHPDLQAGGDWRDRLSHGFSRHALRGEARDD